VCGIVLCGILAFNIVGAVADIRGTGTILINPVRWPDTCRDLLAKKFNQLVPQIIKISNVGDSTTEEIDCSHKDFKGRVEIDPVISYDLNFCLSTFRKGLAAKGVRFRNLDFSSNTLIGDTLNFAGARFGDLARFSFAITDKNKNVGIHTKDPKHLVDVRGEGGFHKLMIPFADTDPDIPPLSESVTNWFDNLNILQGVPFNYLVPDERFLGNNAIRFFEIDNYWIDCLWMALSAWAASANPACGMTICCVSAALHRSRGTPS